MQAADRNPAHTIRAPGSNSEDAAKRVQLSANTTCRLEKLSRWRIDPALIKFPKRGFDSEGGNQVMKPSSGCLKPDGRIARLEGDNKSQGAEGSKVERKLGNEEQVEREDQEFDDETCGRRKPVAVKKMKMKTSDEVVRVLCLTLREAEFLVSLSHGNIIKLEGIVEDVSKEVIWLVFPWEANGNLKDFVALHDWEIPERISLIFDVTRGVQYLHSRTPPICHGDLKSVNILVNSKCHAIITDFGSAHHPVAKSPNKEKERTLTEHQPAPSLEAIHCPSTNTITLTCNHYTLRWAAPELLEEDDGGLASDIWAFGCVAYEVMTDSIPFQDVKDAIVIKRVVRGDLPSISSDARMLLIQALCTLIRQCWTIEPSKRPTAKDCRDSIAWIPMITPNPIRTEGTADFVNRSPALLTRLGRIYRRQGDYPTASKYFTDALAIYTDNADSRGQSDALWDLAHIHKLQCQYIQAVTFFSKCLQIRTDIGSRGGRAEALKGLADMHRHRGEYSQAVAFYAECLQIWTDMGTRRGMAEALSGLADVHRLRNEFSQAVTFYSECLQIKTDTGDRRGRAEALWGLADVHRLRSEYNHAVTFYSESLQICTDIGERRGRAEALFGLAEVHRARSDYEQAVKFYSECLKVRTDIGNRRGRASALWGLAEVHRLQKKYSQAMALFSEALAIFTDLGNGSSRALTLQCMADAHRDQDDLTTAIHYYQEAANLYKKIDHTNDEAMILKRGANVRRLMEQRAA